MGIDILGIDILGKDILGIDILAPTLLQARPATGISFPCTNFKESSCGSD